MRPYKTGSLKIYMSKNWEICHCIMEKCKDRSLLKLLLSLVIYDYFYNRTTNIQLKNQRI